MNVTTRALAVAGTALLLAAAGGLTLQPEGKPKAEAPAQPATGEAYVLGFKVKSIDGNSAVLASTTV